MKSSKKNQENVKTFELNLDGLIGPTHNYSGLSFGNIASIKHQQLISNPKEAAKQGLEKMWALTKLGIKQAIMPPHERPYFPFLRSLGYTGNENQIIQEVAKDNFDLLLICSSSSNMWTANAATVCPSADSIDKKVHFVPANLVTKIHRSIEPQVTSLILKKIFPDSNYFVHHDPLPAHVDFADEGAANHTRFCQDYGKEGIHLFVFGYSNYKKDLKKPLKFPARQSYEASKGIARLFNMPQERIIFFQQDPLAIDRGVFHNDVISVGNKNVFFYHEKAFEQDEKGLLKLKNLFEEQCQCPFHLIKVVDNDISLEESVNTYLFNSQLISLDDQMMALIAPTECQTSKTVSKYLDWLIKQPDQPIKKVIYQDVRQSMQNGGGPACLRLRIVLNETELSHMHVPVILTESLYSKLLKWVDDYYRERLEINDLLDPSLLIESKAALDELTKILKLGPIYSFQK